MKIFLRRLLPALVAVALAAAGGWEAGSRHQATHMVCQHRRVAAKKYLYTSPLLDVELPEGVSVTNEPHPFKRKIVSFLENEKRKGLVKEVSVYYRDLQDGPWFSINPGVAFDPASMMKVPVMVAWLKRAEKDPAVLQRRLRYDPSKTVVPEQYTKPQRTIVGAGSYTIDELLRYMMNYSDNRATSLLYGALTDAELGSVIDGMDVENNATGDTNSLSIHSYSGFFRILYNASFLNREMSEKALGLLTLQDFPQGIAAGVPTGIPVAAKFGEVVPESGNEEIQLHEFGIVYHPKSPYILGIMTRGRNFDAQAAVIREVSRRVYSQVDSSIR